MALAGRAGIVFGVANHRSLAWAVAAAWRAAGARVGVTVQSDRYLPAVARAVERGHWPVRGEAPAVAVCDATDDAQLRAAVERLCDELAPAAKASGADGGAWRGGVNSERWALDMVLHAVAYAPTGAMRGAAVDPAAGAHRATTGEPRRLLAVTKDDFAVAHTASAYSLVAVARAVHPYLRATTDSGDGDDPNSRRHSPGGSLIALTFAGSAQVVPAYSVMGPAKASLEACAKYLAAELGQDGIRVNCISAGPVNTLAARGIAGFTDLSDTSASVAPLARGDAASHGRVTASDVADAATFLAGDAARSITGHTLFVDAGLHIMAPGTAARGKHGGDDNGAM